MVSPKGPNQGGSQTVDGAHGADRGDLEPASGQGGDTANEARGKRQGLSK